MAMKTIAETREKPAAYRKWLGAYCLLVAFLAVIPFLLNVVHIQFLPSPAFLPKIRMMAIMVGLATSLLCLGTLSNVEKRDRTEKDKQATPAALLVSLFLAVLGYYSTMTTIPMAAAIFGGTDIEMTFLVKDPDYLPSKYCRTSVLLDYLPPSYGALCNFPTEFTRSLNPGSEIVVTGRGTSWGLFVRSARLR